jgi:hypothetical protein
MSTSFRGSTIVAGLSFLMMTATAVAATPAESAPSHLRPTSAELRAIVSDVLERSATAREMAERLEQSDVVVYVRYRWFQTTQLQGRIGLVESGPDNPTRLLVLELAMGLTRVQQMVALGHELRHAVEIAAASSIVDAHSLSAHYAAIGVRVSSEPGAEMFETDAACEAAAQVRLEVTSSSVSTEHHRR